jgi:hypothetical protein
VKKIGCLLLEDAGANPTRHVFPGAFLHNHRIDAVQVQKTPEYQSGWSGPYDRNLCP